MRESLRITYVVSQYPAISHTFILGEINGLEQGNIEVFPTSVNAPDRPYEKLTPLEQAASDKTVFIKSTLKRKLIPLAVKTFFKNPARFAKAKYLALKFGFHTPSLFVKNIAYFLEGLVVAEVAQKNHCDQIHAHFTSQGCSVAMFASILSGIPFSVTVHGPDEFYNVNELQLVEKFKRARFIVAISDFAKSQIMKFSEISDWDKIVVNNLGVNSSIFTPIEKNNATPSLLCVGRLVAAKGQGVLLQAAKQLADRGVAFQLKLVGDGPDRATLEHYVAENNLAAFVHFLGKVNHDKVVELQQASDVFVIPSFAEGVPIVLMEAMASGTPCVTTHITGIPELITHNHDGLLVPAGSVDKLAGALERILSDKSLRESLAQHAVTTIRDQWELSKSNDRLAAIFEKQLTP